MHSNDHRICFVGDSFVHGTLDPACLGWVGRVAAQARANGYELTHYNLGVRRETSRDIAARWKQECAARLPAGSECYVVFSFGVNDTSLENGARRVHETESVQNFHNILTSALGSYRTAVVGPAPVADAAHNQCIVELCRRFEQTAANLGVPYLPVAKVLLDDSAWRSEVAADDGSHPQARGYERLAALVLAWPRWWFVGNTEGIE